MAQLTDHIKKLLVVGGGVGGPAAAIRMAERGVSVDLIDIEDNWGAAGTGQTWRIRWGFPRDPHTTE